MKLTNLKLGLLQKRYKRFLADVLLQDSGETITAHCPNSGSMMGLKDPNMEVFVEHLPEAKNLKYKLKIVKDYNNSLVGIDTMLTNKLVNEALQNKKIEELIEFDTILREKKFNNSRFDFYLKSEDKEAFLEVKNVTLKREEKTAEFPDAKTERGAKHLLDLIKVKDSGLLAYNLYIIQREDIEVFKIAKDLDQNYYNNFLLAKEKGVEFLCYNCRISSEEIIINKKIPIEFI